MEAWKFYLGGVLIHIVFFYSIFDIYFTSPLVHGMTPHMARPEPPAKRLVLFSADGLRADKMFELDRKGQTRIPFLRHIMENRGAWGVSHTRVPTESRPGHVALIAGFYEDVSAVAKGWKENPVEFDSVFNESTNTWSWGSPDILPMFAKGATGDHVFTKTYPAHFEDFGSSNQSKLDTWVFDEVKEFFEENEHDDDMKEKLQQTKLVFFLHLLGIDTNGHSNKPFSDEYLNNIKLVDAGVKDMVDVIEKFYGYDGRTAYILTSDHGMTDWGSHGAGHASETLTPIVAWGSGIRSPQYVQTQKYDDIFSHKWRLDHLKRFDIQQADVAPLMSALIGTNFPMNNVGILPYDYLSVSDSDLAEMMYANTRQLLEQYQVKMEQRRSTTLSFAFRPFKELTPSIIVNTHRHMKILLQNGRFHDAIDECSRVMESALKGLNYYQTYDRMFLGLSISSGFLGWMTCVLIMVCELYSGVVERATLFTTQDRPWWASDKFVMTVFGSVGTVMSTLLYLTSLPWTNYVYCLMPVLLWMNVALRRDTLKQVYQHVTTMNDTTRKQLLLNITGCLVGLEILVIGFFYRQMFTVGLSLIAVLPWIVKTDKNLFTKKPKRQLMLWSVSSLLLSAFPLLPVVTGKRNIVYVLVGGVLVFIVAIISSLKKLSLQNIKDMEQKPLLCLQLAAVGIATYFAGYAVETGLSTWQHFISWVLLGTSLVEPMFSSTRVSTRLHTVFLAFCAPFILLSVSYEVIFLFALMSLLYQWLKMEVCLIPRAVQARVLNKDIPILQTFNFIEGLEYHPVRKRNSLVIADIPRAFYYIFIIFASFFGTGNIASVNSFDPSSVLCFVSVFSPFIMGGLLLFKIVIPFVLVTCTLRGVHVVTRLPVNGLFLIILLMSDCMALHFFFLVQDYGSWLDIGTSISHYVIVMCMIIFTMMLFGVSHVLTTYCWPTLHEKQIYEEDILTKHISKGD